MPEPEADRPHYADGTVVPLTIDESTRQWSRGVNRQTGAKSAEPTEPAPTATSITPTGGPLAGGTTVTLTGDNLGGTTGVTVGGAAATSVAVASETQLSFVTPAGTAGAKDVVVQNPAGNATMTGAFTYA